MSYFEDEYLGIFGDSLDTFSVLDYTPTLWSKLCTEDQDRWVSELMRYWKKQGFPYPTYSASSLEKEARKLRRLLLRAVEDALQYQPSYPVRMIEAPGRLREIGGQSTGIHMPYREAYIRGVGEE